MSLTLRHHVNRLTHRRGRGAFTLIEVTMAIGIFVFVVTALLGLMPTALEAARNSLDTSTATQLADAIHIRLARMEFSQLPSTDTTMSFDQSGNEVTGGSEPGQYQANIALADSVSPMLRRLRVTVTRGANKKTFCYLLYNDQQ